MASVEVVRGGNGNHGCGPCCRALGRSRRVGGVPGSSVGRMGRFRWRMGLGDDRYLYGAGCVLVRVRLLSRMLGTRGSRRGRMLRCRMGIGVASVHVSVLTVAVVLGVRDAENNGALVLANLPGTAPQVAEKAAEIALKNARAMIAMLGLGISSVGVMPSIILALNGYGAGMMVASWFNSRPDVAMIMLQYLPLEFASMFVASCASSCLGLSVLRWSMGSERVEWKKSWIWFLVAVVLMLLAAGVEAVSGFDLWRMTV